MKYSILQSLIIKKKMYIQNYERKIIVDLHFIWQGILQSGN